METKPTEEQKQEEVQEVEVDLKPKKPAKLAPQGIRTFTVCRLNDESGVSGTGIVIEGIVLATGQCVVHWLYPAPRGSIAMFDSISDFATVHIKPHPGNESIITYEDGEQVHYRDDGSVLTKPAPEEEEEKMRVVEKPWGKEEIWAETDKYLGKFLYINIGEMLSRQYHEVKDETICVVEGILMLELGKPEETGFKRVYLTPGSTFRVKPGTVHRFCASTVNVKLAEVSTPEIDDVVRLEDKYSR